MDFGLIPFAAGLIHRQAVNDVVQCNEETERYGLRLTQGQAIELVETRATALRENGRIEFGGGVIDKIIKAFCDSPYLLMQNYAQTLHELIEIFYYYKNETMDLISDDELISFMKTAFDGVCQGSLELLSDKELYKLSRQLHGAYEDDEKEEEEEYEQ